MITGAKRFCSSVGLAFAATSCGDDTAPLPAFEAVVFEMRATVEPGAEVHLCQFVKLPDGDEEIFVKGGRYDTSNGTHHFLLFRTATCQSSRSVSRSTATRVTVSCNTSAGSSRAVS